MTLNSSEAAELATLRQDKAAWHRQAVMALPEAKGLEPLAEVIAKEGMPLEHARNVLAASPRSPRYSLAENMKKILAAHQRG